ncbi:hypothetical protein [Arthrobacter sp. JSM 101049]|uniref:hypothetical protein n=1 Tax=Arthrobacter sp. JSM 101049 TaxID=929097 RepID=UPI003562D127
MSKKPAQRRKKPRNRPNQQPGAGTPAARGTGAAAPRRATGPAPRPGSALANTTTGRTPEQAQGNGNLILWAGFGAVVLLFWYYHLLVLNQMTDLSGGLAMPDQLIGGYDAGHIDALRQAMDDDARGQLRYVHKTAGTLFPLFTALLSMLVIGLHVRHRPARWALWALPLAFAITDLWDNALIDGLLAAPADAPAVALASGLTVASWILLFATAAVVIVVAVAAFVRTFRQKWGEAGLS